MTVENALTLARAGRQAAEAVLFEELRIPSISTLPEHRPDVERNADWLVALFEEAGFSAVLGGKEIGSPVVHAEWMNAGDDRPVVTVYGHYDVQPIDPIEDWQDPPFDPVVRDGSVYARGTADNKGNHMAAINAAVYLTQAGGSPVNFRFLLEGEEESAGSTLETYLRTHAEMRSDVTMLWDFGCTVTGNPAIVTGMRGLLAVELIARGAASDLHSGSYGGVAPNAIQTLARVIGELKTRDGRITIPGFYDFVREVDAAVTADWDRSPAHAESLRKLIGAELEGEPDYPAVDRQWRRPTLDVNGVVGGFNGEGLKTVIPASARAKVSMRLVPDQNPASIAAALTEYVAELSTPGVEISVRHLASAEPLVVSPTGHAVPALRSALEAAFARPAAVNWNGSSLPVAATLRDVPGGEVLGCGVTQPGAGAHSPREHLLLENFHLGTEALIRFAHLLADH
jgi:acetylornithine deacetylase/succinyl-diaminopimelate desuccinylase-like protein